MRRLTWLLMLFLAGRVGTAGDPIRVVDDVGREVRLAAPAQRIVSLAPHLTELLFEAGAGKRVVGVSEHSSYPAEAQRLPSVGGGAGLDVEAIIALQPDLVLAWQSGNSAGQLAQLERFGLVLFYSEPGELEAIATTLERLGTLAGRARRANEAAGAYREGLARLTQRFVGRKSVSVFYQIWERPLMTVGGTHMISAWLRMCGAANVFSDLPQLAPAVSVEAVLAANPQVIVAGHYAGKSSAWQHAWRAWPQLRAVAGDHLYTVPAEMMERYTPRTLVAAEELCEYIERARRD